MDDLSYEEYVNSICKLYDKPREEVESWLLIKGVKDFKELNNDDRRKKGVYERV